MRRMHFIDGVSIREIHHRRPRRAQAASKLDPFKGKKANPDSKGILERSHRFLRSNFEPGRLRLSRAPPGGWENLTSK